MPVTTLVHVPPVAALLTVTGLAVWAEGLYFLGVGAKPKDPLDHEAAPQSANHSAAGAHHSPHSAEAQLGFIGVAPEAGTLHGSHDMARSYASSPAMAGIGATVDTAAAAAAVRPAHRLKNPERTVGMIMFIAGLMDLIMVMYIITGKPLENPVTTTLASMVIMPAAWFCYLGISQVLELDLRSVGNVAIPVGLVPLVWWNFFGESVMIQADLIIWGVAFLACAAHAHGKLSNKVLGAYLVFVAIFAFFLQPSMWALSIPLP